jgi:hypothetical protein
MKRNCRLCKYFKLINTQCKTAQDLFEEYCNNSKIIADCTLSETLFPMFDYQECRFSDEEFRELEENNVR